MHQRGAPLELQRREGLRELVDVVGVDLRLAGLAGEAHETAPGLGTTLRICLSLAEGADIPCGRR